MLFHCARFAGVCAFLHLQDMCAAQLQQTERSLQAASADFVPPPLTVPGTIEAEFFMPGVQGVAYLNILKKGEDDPGGSENVLRYAAMTVGPIDKDHPVVGEISIGWLQPHEFMNYKVTCCSCLQQRAFFLTALTLSLFCIPLCHNDCFIGCRC
jgi:hypothetical protein